MYGCVGVCLLDDGHNPISGHKNINLRHFPLVHCGHLVSWTDLRPGRQSGSQVRPVCLSGPKKNPYTWEVAGRCCKQSGFSNRRRAGDRHQQIGRFSGNEMRWDKGIAATQQHAKKWRRCHCESYISLVLMFPFRYLHTDSPADGGWLQSCACRRPTHDIRKNTRKPERACNAAASFRYFRRGGWFVPLFFVSFFYGLVILSRGNDEGTFWCFLLLFIGVMFLIGVFASARTTH